MSEPEIVIEDCLFFYSFFEDFLDLLLEFYELLLEFEFELPDEILVCLLLVDFESIPF